MVIIRLDYLALCSGYKHAKCAAALLNMFERWHSYKLHQRTEIKMRRKPSRKRKQANGLWVYMSQADIHRELFEVFGLNMIGDALRELVKRGYIQERQNPNLKRDRTKQYLFLVDAVQKAVDDFKLRWMAARKAVESCESGVRPFFKFKECKLYSQRLEALVLKFRCFKTKEALPLNTTLESKQKSTKRENAPAQPAPADATPLSPSKPETPEPAAPAVERDETVIAATPSQVQRIAKEIPITPFHDTLGNIQQQAAARPILEAHERGINVKAPAKMFTNQGYITRALDLLERGISVERVEAVTRELAPTNNNTFFDVYDKIIKDEIKAAAKPALVGAWRPVTVDEPAPPALSPEERAALVANGRQQRAAAMRELAQQRRAARDSDLPESA